MMKLRRIMSLATAFSCSVHVTANAQQARDPINTRPTNVGPVVHQQRIVVAFPLPYFAAKKPDPPVRGYYAWKVVFGDAPNATVVFRTDSALSAVIDGKSIRNGSLYVCSSSMQFVNDCTRKGGGSARIGEEAMSLEITEPSVVSWVRENRPVNVVRQMFEPGGRYRVDQLKVTYRATKPDGAR